MYAYLLIRKAVPTITPIASGLHGSERKKSMFIRAASAVICAQNNVFDCGSKTYTFSSVVLFRSLPKRRAWINRSLIAGMILIAAMYAAHDIPSIMPREIHEEDIVFSSAIAGSDSRTTLPTIQLVKSCRTSKRFLRREILQVEVDLELSRSKCSHSHSNSAAAARGLSVRHSTLSWQLSQHDDAAALPMAKFCLPRNQQNAHSFIDFTFAAGPSMILTIL